MTEFRASWEKLLQSPLNGWQETSKWNFSAGRMSVSTPEHPTIVPILSAGLIL